MNLSDMIQAGGVYLTPREKVERFLSSNTTVSPELAALLRAEPGRLNWIESEMQRGYTPSTLSDYQQRTALAQRMNEGRYGSGGVLTDIANLADTAWVGSDNSGDANLRGFVTDAVSLYALGSLFGSAGAAGTAGGTTATTTTLPATLETGLTAADVAAGAGAAGAAEGMLTPSGSTATATPTATSQSVTGTGGTGQPTTSNAGFWDTAGNWITSPQGIGTVANLAGGMIQGQQSQNALNQQAQAQLAAGQQAANLSSFRPVGVTTGFGSSQFGYDENGRLTSAGYQLTPEMQRQRDRLIAQSGNLLTQYQGAQAATAPMGQAAQSMFNLGQGYLSTSPQEQAARYMADQQALLSTSRERQLSGLQNQLAQQGRLGLATGATGMMGAANPELEAFYNAQRQQDLGLAAQATQGGMEYARFGAGMVGMGGTTLRDMYGTQTAAYQPYATALGGAQSVEQLGQGAMNIGTALGQQVSTAGMQQGQFLTGSQQQAGQYQVPAQSYNPYASLLGGVGQSMNQYGSTNQNQWGS